MLCAYEGCSREYSEIIETTLNGESIQLRVCKECYDEYKEIMEEK